MEFGWHILVGDWIFGLIVVFGYFGRDLCIGEMLPKFY